MRKLVLGVLIGFFVAASAAFALDVSFPPRSKAQARIIVDELGNILFGAMPAKVEVTNWPASPIDSTGTPWSAVVDVASPAPSVVAFTVPADSRLLLTDIDGAYACAAGGPTRCTLSDSHGARLTWNSGGYDSPHHSYSTGVLFDAGEIVTMSAPIAVQGPSISFQGRLLPAS